MPGSEADVLTSPLDHDQRTVSIQKLSLLNRTSYGVVTVLIEKVFFCSQVGVSGKTIPCQTAK